MRTNTRIAGQAKGKIAWAQVAVAVGATASVVTILNYFDIRPWRAALPSKKTVDVRSYNQSGGITAGELNVGQPLRRVTPDVASQLEQLVTKGQKVVVTAVMGDQEAFQFATEVKQYLVSHGYEVDGVNQGIFTTPVVGQSVNPTEAGVEIVIGARG